MDLTLPSDCQHSTRSPIHLSPEETSLYYTTAKLQELHHNRSFNQTDIDNLNGLRKILVDKMETYNHEAQYYYVTFNDIKGFDSIALLMDFMELDKKSRYGLPFDYTPRYDSLSID